MEDKCILLILSGLKNAHPIQRLFRKIWNLDIIGLIMGFWLFFAYNHKKIPTHDQFFEKHFFSALQSKSY
jgi:hypothetical protein